METEVCRYWRGAEQPSGTSCSEGILEKNGGGGGGTAVTLVGILRRILPRGAVVLVVRAL